MEHLNEEQAVEHGRLAFDPDAAEGIGRDRGDGEDAEAGDQADFDRVPHPEEDEEIPSHSGRNAA